MLSGDHIKDYTPLAVVSHAHKTQHVSTTATIAQILAVLSKEGALIGTVIGAVLSTRKFHH
jgi:precorrin-4 methylase